jgi:hypothetical protein
MNDLTSIVLTFICAAKSLAFMVRSEEDAGRAAAERVERDARGAAEVVSDFLIVRGCCAQT